MVCEICEFNHNEVLCPKCGWENEIILDTDYLEIYERKKAIYKNLLDKPQKDNLPEFIDKLIEKYKKHIQTNLEIASIFIDDILDITQEYPNYHIEFLFAKLYINYNQNQEVLPIIEELKKRKHLMNNSQKEKFEDYKKQIED